MIFSEFFVNFVSLYVTQVHQKFMCTSSWSKINLIENDVLIKLLQRLASEVHKWCSFRCRVFRESNMGLFGWCLSVSMLHLRLSS
jgi:hypothetical protein